MRAALAFLLLSLTAPALAQIRPQPGAGDPRIQSVVYDPEQVVQLEIVPGYQLGIEFAPGERIENVAVGNSGAWNVTPNRRGDRLFIKALQGDVRSNLTVVTDARTYVFELIPAYSAQGDIAFTLRFEYPPPASARSAPATPAEAGRYRVSGNRALRPSEISDDGSKTYVVFAADQAMPAIFAVDGQGEERLVDGAVRDDVYVIDSVSDRLIFRLGKQTAQALRYRRAKAAR